MPINSKKIAVVVIFVVAVLLFAFFLYYFFFRPISQLTDQNNSTGNESQNGQLNISGNANGRTVINGNESIPENQNTVINELPSETAQGGITKTSSFTINPAYFVTKGPGGELLYYDNNTGKFYRIGADGNISALSDKSFYDISNVTWANNRDKAVLEFPDGSNILFNFTTGKQITLPKHWEDFTFSTSDQKIAFKSIGLSPENHYLTIANSDGSQAQAIENIAGIESQVIVNWSPNNQMVATVSKGKDLDRSEIYFVGLNNENFKLMVVEGRDFQGQWSPKGEKMIYSVYNSQNDYKPQLWIADTKADTIGNNRKNLDLQTWSDKCTFSGDSKVYCAVPKELSFGAGLDPRIANNTPDQIYEINLQTGTKTLVAIPDADHTIGQLIVNSSYIFFTDKNTNKIYKINLP